MECEIVVDVPDGGGVEPKSFLKDKKSSNGVVRKGRELLVVAVRTFLRARSLLEAALVFASGEEGSFGTGEDGGVVVLREQGEGEQARRKERGEREGGRELTLSARRRRVSLREGWELLREQPRGIRIPSQVLVI